MIVKFFLKRENQDFFYWVLFKKKRKEKEIERKWFQTNTLSNIISTQIYIIRFNPNWNRGHTNVLLKLGNFIERQC